jgi:hypothetical protein
MFDPFGDFETAGYLRNTSAEKDVSVVKAVEHTLFRAQLPEAFAFLGKCRTIGYEDFLHVHHLLFSGLYPWAGQDRAAVMPEKAISTRAARSSAGKARRLSTSGPSVGSRSTAWRSRRATCGALCVSATCSDPLGGSCCTRSRTRN